MFKKNKTILIVAAIIVIAALIYLVKNNQTENNGAESKLRPIDSTDHIIGDLGAPVQMIIYSDFECPYCAQFANTVKTINQEFGNKVAIAFRHYPLAGHKQAAEAAEASECAAEQGKFWGMYDKLFTDNTAGKMSKEQFEQDAVDLGLNKDQFNQCLDSGKYADKVKTLKEEGDEAGVTGTPTSFINGNIYPGAYPFEDFTASDGAQEKGMKSIIIKLLNNE